MNLIELLYSEGKKDELIELFTSMQDEMREMNSKIQRLEDELEAKEKKVKIWKKRYNQACEDF